MSIIINNIDDIFMYRLSFRSDVGLVAWLEKSAGCHPVDKPWDDRGESLHAGNARSQ
ncbi:hypothetical protein RPAGB_0269 [Rickettsia parkeri str. Grand Bay]|nr:hypothetical protein RPAGB_0269 [Rickettsia parkeri str. Grand Bay]